jgi:hypothetical protein
VRDLVVSLILRTAEIEKQTAVGDLAFVAVRDGVADGGAVGAVLDGVLDATNVCEFGLEVEVNGGGTGRDHQLVARDVVGAWGAVLVGADGESGCGQTDRGEEG